MASTNSGFADNIKMIKKYQQTHNLELRNQIIENNLSLIYSVIHRYNKVGNDVCYEFDDLISEGVLGLISAIDNFDPNRGTSFSTYATFWIIKGVSVSFKMGTLSMPIHRISLYKKYAEIKDALASSGQALDLEDVAGQLNVSEKILADTINQKESASIEGMSANLSFDHSSKPSVDKALFLSSGEDEEQKIFDRLDYETIMGLMEQKLSDKESLILKGRFGIDRDEAMTLEQIADDLGVSYEHVRIVQNKAIEKLRRTL